MKSYYLKFGSGDPRTFTGMSPTFLIFKTTDGSNISPPGITEVPSGTGIYYFNWGTTTSISFLADSATTSPGTALRYITGGLDPADRADEYGTTIVAIGTSLTAGQGNVGTTLVAIGNSSIALGTSIYALEQNIGSTLIAIGNTVLVGVSMNALIGTTASIIGDNSHDPFDLFGYLKRINETLQGQEQFVKSTGALTMYDRTGATTLANRTVSNNASLVIKS